MVEFLKDPSFRMWLWERAVPMREARLRFAPPELKAEWDQLYSGARNSDDPAGEALEAKLNASLQSDLPPTERVLSAFKVFGEHLKPQQQTSAKLDHNLENFIKTGRLLILGFPDPRNYGDHPVLITPQQWLTRREKDGHKILSQSLTFLEVRMIPLVFAQKSADQQLAALAQSADVAPVGRPSFGPAILEAFEVLQASGAIDTKGQKLPIYTAIRAWIHKTHPDLASKPGSPNDETIRRVITPLIQQSNKL